MNGSVTYNEAMNMTSVEKNITVDFIQEVRRQQEDAIDKANKTRRFRR